MSPEDVARGLSEAQRKWLPTFDAVPRPWFPVGCSRKTVDALVTLKLIEKTPPKSGFGMILFGLTPLGAQVRAILKGQP